MTTAVMIDAFFKRLSRLWTLACTHVRVVQQTNRRNMRTWHS
jgi:hypothetical protein